MIKEPQDTDLSKIVPNKLYTITQPDSEFESKLNLLYVLLNSRAGELVYDSDFGIN